MLLITRSGVPSLFQVYSEAAHVNMARYACFKVKAHGISARLV